VKQLTSLHEALVWTGAGARGANVRQALSVSGRRHLYCRALIVYEGMPMSIGLADG
jgi:hypothetical protein